MARNQQVKPAPTPPGKLSHRDVAVLAYSGMATFELGIVIELFGLPRPEFSEWYRFKVCALEAGPLVAPHGPADHGDLIRGSASHRDAG